MLHETVCHESNPSNSTAAGPVQTSRPPLRPFPLLRTNGRLHYLSFLRLPARTPRAADTYRCLSPFPNRVWRDPRPLQGPFAGSPSQAQSSAGACPIIPPIPLSPAILPSSHPPAFLLIPLPLVYTVFASTGVGDPSHLRFPLLLSRDYAGLGPPSVILRSFFPAGNARLRLLHWELPPSRSLSSVPRF